MAVRLLDWTGRWGSWLGIGDVAPPVSGQAFCEGAPLQRSQESLLEGRVVAGCDSAGVFGGYYDYDLVSFGQCEEYAEVPETATSGCSTQQASRVSPASWARLLPRR